MRNNGFVICGRSIEESFKLAYDLILACETQVLFKKTEGKFFFEESFFLLTTTGAIVFFGAIADLFFFYWKCFVLHGFCFVFCFCYFFKFLRRFLGSTRKSYCSLFFTLDFFTPRMHTDWSQVFLTMFKVVLLQGNGFVVCGSSVEETFHLTFILIQACEAQVVLFVERHVC